MRIFIDKRGNKLKFQEYKSLYVWNPKLWPRETEGFITVSLLTQLGLEVSILVPNMGSFHYVDPRLP